jgi:hypothetical protein
VDSGEDLDQGALSGTVGSEECVYLSGLDVEIDCPKRDDTAEVLGDAARRQ